MNKKLITAMTVLMILLVGNVFAGEINPGALIAGESGEEGSRGYYMYQRGNQWSLTTSRLNEDKREGLTESSLTKDQYDAIQRIPSNLRSAIDPPKIGSGVSAVTITAENNILNYDPISKTFTTAPPTEWETGKDVTFIDSNGKVSTFTYYSAASAPQSLAGTGISPPSGENKNAIMVNGQIHYVTDATRTALKTTGATFDPKTGNVLISSENKRTTTMPDGTAVTEINIKEKGWVKDTETGTAGGQR
ncbi:hypothetical protein GOV06_02420, partial [Candidatus Woesearchaeota archaeon]|nr:hypothetical protein [Candidatus Woesearchaeota archaeon]